MSSKPDPRVQPIPQMPMQRVDAEMGICQQVTLRSVVSAIRWGRFLLADYTPGTRPTGPRLNEFDAKLDTARGHTNVGGDCGGRVGCLKKGGPRHNCSPSPQFSGF